MTSDIAQRALKLLEQEDVRNGDIAARRAEQEKDGRLKDAIGRIQKKDREHAAEQSRRKAEARAAELSHQRYELGEELEAAAANLNRLLSEYESVHRRHTAALREAGRPLDHGYRLQEIVSARFRQWFGGFNSLTGVPSPFHGAQDIPLPERDPLASGGSNPDTAA